MKRDLPDHVVVFNEHHLRRMLRDSVEYYDAEGTGTILLDSPPGRPVQIRASRDYRVVGQRRLRGLDRPDVLEVDA